MEIVLIDTFIVPEESKNEFRKGAAEAQSFVGSLPGYVEGYIYEQTDGESNYNFLTTAVWKNEEAFENAKKVVLINYQKRGFDPEANRKRLKIEHTRSTYARIR